MLRVKRKVTLETIALPGTHRVDPLAAQALRKIGTVFLELEMLRHDILPSAGMPTSEQLSGPPTFRKENPLHVFDVRRWRGSAREPRSALGRAHAQVPMSLSYANGI
jgi:hypothetical protein